MKQYTTTVVSCAVLAGVACSAHAQAVPGLDIQLSYDQTVWHESLVEDMGHTIYVRVLMSVPTTAYGIAGARYNITSGAGQWDVGGNDVADLTPGKGNAGDGRRAGFDFGGQTQQVFESGNRLRIDAKGDTGDNPNAGISSSQNTPGALGTLFNTSKVAEVYRFSVTITSETMMLNGGVVRLAIEDAINGPTNQITSFKYYASSGSTSGTQLDGARGDVAYIYIPSPGTMLGVVLPLIAAGRRRR